MLFDRGQQEFYCRRRYGFDRNSLCYFALGVCRDSLYDDTQQERQGSDAVRLKPEESIVLIADFVSPCSIAFTDIDWSFSKLSGY
jgi:hypothetical protein